MWKHIVEQGKSQMILWRICISRCIPKVTNTLSECRIRKNQLDVTGIDVYSHWVNSTCFEKKTHSEYLIRIDFLLQQWLHEQASVLCYMYIACPFDHI
jgi:hypothetical protein